MKKINFVLAILFLVSVSISCNKDKEELLAYEGTWTTTKTWNGYSVKDELALTKDSFKDLFKTEFQPGVYITAGGIKGALSVSENKMVFNVEEVGIADFENGTFEWYKSEDAEFSEILDQFSVASFMGEYEISGEKMIVKLDLDGDNEYSSFETAEYSRR